MIFKSGYKITQNFGERPDYYKQFGLAGHEGLDVVPLDSDWNVLCLADGVVVKDQDDPRSGAYGDFVTVWHPQLKKATQYCHFSTNYINLNDQVKAGQALGKMGSTGNSTGPHCHINLFNVDDNGARLNRDNGYQGGIDPLPFIKSLEGKGDETTMGNISISTDKFQELVRKANQWDTVADATSTDKNDEKGGEKIAKIISDLKSSVTELNQALGESNQNLTTANAEIVELKNTPPQTIEKPVDPKDIGELIGIITKFFKKGK